MNVFYKCRCMAEEAAVAVADRRDDQDIVNWVEMTVGAALAADHHQRSPLCRSQVTEYAKFEIDPAGAPLGRMTKQ